MKRLAQILALPRGSAWRGDQALRRAKLGFGVLLLWAAYIGVVQLIASAATREFQNRSLPGRGDYLLHGFVEDLSTAPALARWDSIWYYGIAHEGYLGGGPDSRHTPAFLPLYPLAMRLTGEILGGDIFRGGIWVSRLSLLAALGLMAWYVRETHAAETSVWPALAALLAFPSAFILASAYSESLFLALTLAAFVLARRRHFGPAACCAFSASLTRIQGLALIPAFAVFAAEDWRAGRRSIASFAPAAAGAAAIAAMAGGCWVAFGDPLYHFAVKRELWHQGFSAPWRTLEAAVEASAAALVQGGFGSMYTLLQLPCAYLVLLVTAILAFEPAQRRWPEVTFMACGLSMSLVGGALDGMPRFTLVLFPVLVVLGWLQRRPALWHAYLIGSSLLQACLIIHYVSFQSPPP